MSLKNVALQSNGGIATATSYSGGNIPTNGNNGSYATGNGNNWYSDDAYAKWMVTFNGIYQITEFRIMTTENWGNSFSTFDIYYTTSSTLTVNDSLSNFTKLNSYSINTNGVLASVTGISFVARKILVVPTRYAPPAMVEFEAYGSIPFKLLFQDGVNENAPIKYYTSSWNTIVGKTKNTLTKQDYTTYGMNDISVLNNDNLKLLSSNYKILLCSDDTTITPKTKLTTIPQPQLIKMKTDINLSGIDKINNINIVINDTNTIIRMIISNDGGMTWDTHDGVNFVNIDISDINNIKSNGITKTIFNSISSDSWNNLLLTNKKLRLGYYMEVNDTTDVCNIDTLSMNVNMQGSWRMAEPKSGSNGEYSYEYKSSTLLKVYLYSANTYKINYPQ